jgi:putative phosphoribosyl transferase
VPVAYEVARELGAPLDVCIVRKIGAPMQAEFGIGAVAEGGTVYVDPETVALVGVSAVELANLVAVKQGEVALRAERFRGGEPALEVRGRTVIVVDDGVATGATARAALQTLRARGAGWIVFAVPVGASDSIDELAALADELVCLRPEDSLFSVGQWYRDFDTTSDEDVIALLRRARSEIASETGEKTGASERPSERVRAVAEREIRIPLDAKDALGAHLSIPTGARGVVLFAHGSGSSRHSARNQYVAGELQRDGLATLLLDLLTDDEEAADVRSGAWRLRFDIELLASRLVTVTDWVHSQPELGLAALGYFGASTGAAAALVASTRRPELVRAIVSRGGRPDLAESSLGSVAAPTLLLVGGHDPEVLQLNRESLEFLHCERRLEIIPGATHLFEEPGTLERVARAASSWFQRFLGDSRAVQVTA